MIECSNCKTQNSLLSIKCKKCGSFIQPRVANLDLLPNLWGAIEKPSKTFLKICRSEQKNYVYILFSYFGLGLIFGIFWLLNIGNKHTNLFYLILLGLVLGPMIGIIVSVFISLVTFIISRFVFRLKVKYRNLNACISYSFAPMVIATFFILPVELILFGLFFFTNNPPPSNLKPTPYYILISLDAISICYSIFLFTIGIRISNDTTKLKSILISFLSLAIIFSSLSYLLLFIGKII